MSELLAALDSFPDIGLIFTKPNADTSGQLMAQLIEKYVDSRANAKSYASMGAVRYLSTLACVDGVVGNSSSGILEAPSCRVGTVNIGDRQRGRLQAASVISCTSNQEVIENAIRQLMSEDFKHIVQNVVSPFGDCGASERIVQIIKNQTNQSFNPKQFVDSGARTL